jgi:hypothetical protein
VARSCEGLGAGRYVKIGYPDLKCPLTGAWKKLSADDEIMKKAFSGGEKIIHDCTDMKWRKE